MRRFRFEGRVAVITGAANGMGAALAAALAARGCHLALADIDAAGLEAVAAGLRSNEIRVTAHGLDVADPEAPAAFAGAVAREHGGAHLLFNNAGIALGGDFQRIAAEDFDALFAVNFHGLVRMTRAFLPLLQAQDEGHLVNTSSLFGLIAPAGQTAYAASKFAVRGFSDALRHELAGTSVGVTTVHPGGVATRIARRAKQPADATAAEIDAAHAISDRLLTMAPERAAAIILSGVERRRPRVLVGRDAHVAALIERLFPASYWPILSRRMGAEGRMRTSA